MKKQIYIYQLLLLLFSGICLISCQDDPDVLDNLQILSLKINDAPAVNGVADIPTSVSVEIIFSHTLDTTALASALSLVGGSGNVTYNAVYSNSNSTLTLSNVNSLDFETTYTLSLATGIYGQTGESLVEALSFSFTTAPFVPANVSLTSDVANINEEGGQAVVTVALSEALELPVSVDLAFGGSATEGVDYTTSARSLNLAAGETSATITLLAQQDGSVEGTETIELSISQVTNAVELTEQMLSISLTDDDIDSNNDGFPDQGFIINEVLFDPPSGAAGDANGDGTRSASADEFIEFINDSDQAVDLSNFTLYDANNLESLSPRHTFPPGTIIPAGGVYVLFGGGSPSGDFGTAQVAVSTTGNMNLSNSDDVITILDAEGSVFLTFDTQVEGTGLSFGSDQSITRFPDINGPYSLHNTANASLDYSPGKKSDGTNIEGGGGSPGLGFIINEVLFDPPSGTAGDANGDGTRSASADEFIEFVNDSDQAVDLSGFTLFDATNLATNTPRHTFPNGTIIPPGGVYVLFGGGSPSGDFGGAQVGVSTTGNMNLSNSDDVITILDGSGNVFLTFDTQGEGTGISFGSDQSVTRNPDITGSFGLHSDANGSLLFSPGTKVDGSPFN